MPVEKHDELPQRPAAAAIMNPSDPLGGTVAGQRVRQAADGTASIVDRHRDEILVARAQLHAPRRRRRITSRSRLRVLFRLSSCAAFGPLAAFTTFGRRATFDRSAETVRRGARFVRLPAPVATPRPATDSASRAIAAAKVRCGRRLHRRDDDISDRAVCGNDR